MEKKNVYITGLAGFGGSGIARGLLERGHKVSGIDIIAPNEARKVRDIMDHENFSYIWGSVHDLKPKDIEGNDVLVHMAAQADVPLGFPAPTWTGWENVLGTIKTLEAAKDAGLEKFILASSGNVFGRPLRESINEDHPLTPHNPYSASKASQEMFTMGFYRAYDVPAVIMRNGIVYGPDMRKQIFVYIWLKNILQGKPIKIEGGKQTRDPCYVADTLSAWIATAEADPKDVVGQAFQVSAGKEYSMQAIAKACMKAAGREVGINYVDYRPGEKGQRECFDNSKAREILGYEPQYSLEQGLERTVEWVRKEEGL